MNWINVKYKLPNIGDWVIAEGIADRRNAKEEKIIAVVQFEYYEPSQKYFWSILTSGCGCCDSSLKNVSHWMPLPDAPSQNSMTEGWYDATKVSPEESGLYDVCYEATDLSRRQCGREWFIEDAWVMHPLAISSDIIYWRPLPQPPK